MNNLIIYITGRLEGLCHGNKVCQFLGQQADALTAQEELTIIYLECLVGLKLENSCFR